MPHGTHIGWGPLFGAPRLQEEKEEEEEEEEEEEFNVSPR